MKVLDFTILYCSVSHSCVLRNLRQKLSLEVKEILNLLWNRICLSSELEIVDEFLAALIALNREDAERN